MTGAFLGEFVNTNTEVHELGPAGLTFGPDGNLYIVNWGTSSVTRYQGPSGTTPGAPMPSPGNSGADFIPDDGGRFRVGGGLVFGPDGNGDDHQDLYVTYSDWTGTWKANHGTVRRYDGVTGSFIDDFVAPDSGGLNNPYFLTFTDTDPVTLAYNDTTTAPTTAIISATLSIEGPGWFDGIPEGDSGTVQAVFSVTLSEPSTDVVTVNFATADGTANAKTDYLVKSGTLTFAPGETTKTIIVEIKGDKRNEDDFGEYFYVNLSDAIGAIIEDDSAAARIVDDDNRNPQCHNRRMC
jgi:hypothetical protein